MLWLSVVLLLGTMQPLSAQIYDADGQYVDTLFHDHINRQADDFIRVSLVSSARPSIRSSFVITLNNILTN